MVKPNRDQRIVGETSLKENRTHVYQQALDDFGITQLLSRISNYCDMPPARYAIATSILPG